MPVRRTKGNGGADVGPSAEALAHDRKTAHLAPGGLPWFRAPKAPEAALPMPPPGQPPPFDQEDQPDLTDTGNAARLARWNRSELRYVHAWGRWLSWDGRRWAVDDEGRIVQAAKAVTLRMLREAAEGLNDAATQTAEARLRGQASEAGRLRAWAMRSRDGARIKKMISLAQSEPPMPVAVASLDGHPWLFNCQNGTIDLQSGRLRRHHFGHLLTKLCPVDYRPEAKCPRWEGVLLTIFAGNSDLVDYFRRLCGYSMTADTSEQLLPVFWGDGSNGKSLLFEIVRAVLGQDYSGVGARELLLGDSDRHPTFKADLFGKRLVTLAETSEGGRLNETLIKDLTGGEPVKARRMREDFWSFEPTHKIWLASNHKPEVRGRDHGIWRRLRLLPFNVRFWDADKGENGPPDLKADKGLKGKLLAEAEGILAWMVRGCLEWQAGGMREPEEVTLATAEYRGEEDIVGQFIEERCRTGQDKMAAAGQLYKAFREWWDATGEPGRPLSQKAFGAALGARPFIERAKSSVKVYHGVALRQADEIEDE